MRYRFAKRISYQTPGSVYGTMGDVSSDWTGERRVAYAVLSPDESARSASPFGGTDENACRLLLDRDCAIRLGDGVWLDGAADTPDAVVMAVRRYATHVEADAFKVVRDG